MNVEKILLDEFTPHIYNDVNQSGEELIVIDVDDLDTCVGNLIKNLTPSVPWQELRKKFFKECTFANEYAPGMKKVSVAPHDLFEWFKKNIEECL